jgi:tetratricopeptide (TPR) repeat protein
MTNLLNSATEHLKAGSYEKALEQFNALIKNEPPVADYYAYRGTVLLNLKRKKDALKDFDRAVELDAQYSYRYACRAFAKDALGDLEGAIADYRKAIELDPDDAIAHNNLGLLEEKAGNKNNAKRHFETADTLAQSFFSQDLTVHHDVEVEETIFEKHEEIEIQSTLNAQTYFSELKKVFSSKNEFSRFVKFIKKGFKR